MADVGSPLQTLASRQVCPWSLELFLPSSGAGTTGDWFSVAASTGLVENLFPSGPSQLSSAGNELFIKTLDTD